MPELAFIGTLGGLASLLFSAYVFYLELKKFKNSSYLLLQQNLRLVNLRWNDLTGDFEPATEGALEKEKSKLVSTLSVITGFAFLLSWLGLFFYVVVYISFKKMARGRKYQKLIVSKVDQVVMSQDQIKQIIDLISKAC